MDIHEIERAAYIAAHRILMANTDAPELACPGARRSRAVDTIAEIIKDVFDQRIVEANTTAAELVCPGSRRSRAVDMIADIIREVFELHSTEGDQMTSSPERGCGAGPLVVKRGRGGAVLRLPSRECPDEVA
jgi:hypothetical protein